MNDEHHEVRDALGAYVLGALEPEERRAVEAHIDRCGRCRDELARFAPLPTLLGRLTAEEAVSGNLGRDIDLLSTLAEETEEERDRLRRRLRAWRLAAAVAAALALVLWAPWDRPPVAVAEAPVAAAEDAVGGEVALYAWEWGTTVELRLVDLPRRERYVVWAVADDGTRQQAGVWGPTAAGTAKVRGASSISPDRISRVEVTDDAGDLVLTVRFSDER